MLRIAEGAPTSPRRRGEVTKGRVFGTDPQYCRYQFRFTLHAGHQVILEWFFEAFLALCC